MSPPSAAVSPVSVATSGSAPVGLGGVKHRLAIYLANRPPIDDYPQLDVLRPLASGELDHIVRHTSNHWRKVFSVYAKLVFEWASEPAARVAAECAGYSRWQDYRDQRLLQSDSVSALLFSAPVWEAGPESEVIHIVAGKTYAEALGLAAELQWLDAHFAVIPAKRLIVCPYLDYRQLSNERITRLITYINTYWGESIKYGEETMVTERGRSSKEAESMGGFE